MKADEATSNHGVRSGTLETIWRYPIKSAGGEKLDQALINKRGLEGDRLFAVYHENGKPGSNKTNQRFQKTNRLLDVTAKFNNGAPLLFLPNGNLITGDLDTLSTGLSIFCDQTLAVQQEETINHFDASPVHILTTSALRWLSNELPGSTVDQIRFRANLIIDTDGDVPVEHDWLDKTVFVGNDVMLKVTALTTRCVMTTLEQQGLATDEKILKHLNHVSDRNLGVYAEVIQGGVVSKGDTVGIE